MRSHKSATVLLAVYIGDCLAEVKKCLDSIFKQSFKDYNILIVIDGELNNEVSLYIKDQEKKVDFISCIKLKKNMGLAHALNCGISNINSEFIIRVDADSVSMPERFKTQIKHLLNNKDIDVLGSMIEELQPEGKKYLQKMPEKHEDCFSSFRYRNPINHPTTVFRKSFFSKAGFYPTKYYKDEDSALWLNGFLNGCIFENINKPLVQCKLDNELLSRRKELKAILYTFINKIRIAYKLKYGVSSYFFAFLRLFVMLSPKTLLMKSYLMRNKIWSLISHEK